MENHHSIDEYVAAQPPAIGERLSIIRALFHQVVPHTQESISYAIPAFTVGARKLYIAAYKNHIGMYPMYRVPELDILISPYRGNGTKDSLHFKHSEPLPLELIKEIILQFSLKKH
jgi:uncharacterized protein YdhG (YjbR/CyaY superfamily)